MRAEWLDYTQRLARTPALFYSGNRKIMRPERLTLTDTTFDLRMEDVGFTRNKQSQLRRNYLHEEARAAAVTLWDARLAKQKYGSVGFHCYKHYVKGKAEGVVDLTPTSKRASVMGPCIQAVNLTLEERRGGGRVTHVDLFYRTTELFKKFPADLVFLEELLTPFNLEPAPLESVTCHFANVTCHPMYFAGLLPLMDDPLENLMALEPLDPYFHKWVVKWTARYLCEEYAHGIAKFAQALRVKADVLERLDPYTLELLQLYLREHHPGYTRTRFAHDGDGNGEGNEEEGPDEEDDDEAGELEG